MENLKKPFALGLALGVLCLLCFAASGPIQHVWLDNGVTNLNSVLCGTTIIGTDDNAAYAANQVVNSSDNVLGAPFTFTNAVRVPGGSAVLDQVRIVVSNATFLPSSFLAVYCTTNVTWFSNYQAFSAYYTNAATRKFIIPLNALAVQGSGGDTATYVSPQLGYLFHAHTGDTNAYFHWYLGGAATPVAYQPYYIEAAFRQLQ